MSRQRGWNVAPHRSMQCMIFALFPAIPAQVAAKVEVEPFMPKENVKIETGACSDCSLSRGARAFADNGRNRHWLQPRVGNSSA